jgi:predicted N-acetyltransferase YhbS
MQIRRLTPVDLSAVMQIQAQSYHAHLHEPPESFAAKLSAGANYCFVAIRDDAVIAYAVAIPSLFGEWLELGDVEQCVPGNADCVYLHDIAVRPDARSSGAASALVEAVLSAAAADGYTRAALVAVSGARSYWERHGFDSASIDDRRRQQLSAYGEGATYMVRIGLGSELST